MPLERLRDRFNDAWSRNRAIAGLRGRLSPFNWAKVLWRVTVHVPNTTRIALLGVREVGLSRIDSEHLGVHPRRMDYVA